METVKASQQNRSKGVNWSLFYSAMVLCKQIVLVSTFDYAILRIQGQFVEDKNR